VRLVRGRVVGVRGCGGVQGLRYARADVCMKGTDSEHTEVVERSLCRLGYKIEKSLLTEKTNRLHLGFKL